MREAHLRDAVALCSLLSFLEKEVGCVLYPPPPHPLSPLPPPLQPPPPISGGPVLFLAEYCMNHVTDIQLVDSVAADVWWPSNK